jgi:short-subunit dehydrogenase
VQSVSLTGQVALVTGASMGIGAEFAEQLARRGADVVLVARSSELLSTLARSLRSRFGGNAYTEVVDLADPDAAGHLFDRVTERGLTIDFLVNSAGVVAWGAVARSAPPSLAEQITINVQSLVGTTARFLPAMVERGHGTIVNVSSTSAFQPAPYVAVYAASKAFVSSFTAAVHAETMGTGVRVLAVCPGATDTPMRAKQQLPAITPVRSAEQVVDTAFRALQGHHATVVDGRRNAFFARVMSRLTPEPMMLNFARRVAEPASENAV